MESQIEMLEHSRANATGNHYRQEEAMRLLTNNHLSDVEAGVRTTRHLPPYEVRSQQAREARRRSIQNEGRTRYILYNLIIFLATALTLIPAFVYAESYNLFIVLDEQDFFNNHYILIHLGSIAAMEVLYLGLLEKKFHETGRARDALIETFSGFT